MKSKDHQKIELSPQQQNPYLASGEDFEVTPADEYGSRYTEGGGQCGASKAEYEMLLRQADRRGKSPLGAKRSPATETSDAGKPRTPGTDEGEG